MARPIHPHRRAVLAAGVGAPFAFSLAPLPASAALAPRTEAAVAKVLAGRVAAPGPVTLGLPTVALDADAARRLRDGRRVAADGPERAALVDPGGHLVAVAEVRAGAWRTLRVWRAGDAIGTDAG